MRKRLESRASLRRMVTPEEVAECAVFFASNARPRSRAG